MSDALVERLDRLIGLFELAYSEQLEQARAEVLADPLVERILSSTVDDWQQVGELKASLAT